MIGTPYLGTMKCNLCLEEFEFFAPDGFDASNGLECPACEKKTAVPV